MLRRYLSRIFEKNCSDFTGSKLVGGMPAYISFNRGGSDKSESIFKPPINEGTPSTQENASQETRTIGKQIGEALHEGKEMAKDFAENIGEQVKELGSRVKEQAKNAARVTGDLFTGNGEDKNVHPTDDPNLRRTNMKDDLKDAWKETKTATKESFRNINEHVEKMIHGSKNNETENKFDEEKLKKTSYELQKSDQEKNQM